MSYQICKSCREELPRGSPVPYCMECYEEHVGGIISHEPAKLYSSGRVNKVERHVEVYEGKWGSM